MSRKNNKKRTRISIKDPKRLFKNKTRVFLLELDIEIIVRVILI